MAPAVDYCGGTSGRVLPDSAVEDIGEQIDSKTRITCLNLLKSLMRHKFGCIFSHPVDPVALQIPDYFDVISKPMDLGTIEKRLESRFYATLSQFAADVRLTFQNAMVYNPPENSVHIIAASLLSEFNKKWDMLELKWRKEQISQIKDAGIDRKDRTAVWPSTNCNPTESISLKKEGRSQSAKLNTRRGVADTKKRKMPSEFVQFRMSKCQFEHSKESLPLVEDAKHERVAEISKEHLNQSVVRPMKKMLKHAHAPSQPSQASAAHSFITSSRGEDTISNAETLSPGKALRAALIKTRFADTIVKAQLLARDKEINPTKLQLEKNKLERRQQEERLKIEAQAKAEAAALKKQADAALRKRQQKREAFRLELQKTERSVIRENTHFSNELKSLQLNPTTYKLINDFMNGVSIAGFRTQLEKLGLYIEEVEDPDDSTSAADLDLEEGEIA